MCYSPAFIGKPELNRGNKSKCPIVFRAIEATKGKKSNFFSILVILPTSALHELARLRIQYPMTFMISNSQMGIKTFCGVLEFSAEEGMCHIPIWMMNNLCIEEGSEIILRNMNL